MTSHLAHVRTGRASLHQLQERFQDPPRALCIGADRPIALVRDIPYDPEASRHVVGEVPEAYPLNASRNPHFKGHHVFPTRRNRGRSFHRTYRPSAEAPFAVSAEMSANL